MKGRERLESDDANKGTAKKKPWNQMLNATNKQGRNRRDIEWNGMIPIVDLLPNQSAISPTGDYPNVG